MTPSFTDISRVLQDYFDGLYHCDTELLARVFHPRAVYATGDETPALIRSMDEYFPVVASRVSPASQGQARRDVIEAIEVAGENTAFARVRCSIGARDFVDFLTLIREDGAWRIIAKVFQIIPHTD
jgi:Putative lumazine-binding